MPFHTFFKDKSSSSKSNADPGMTRQRQTALAIVDAFNRLDTTTIWKLRDRSCWREIYPKSLGAPPQDDNACQQSLNMLANTFKEMHMSVHEIIEDVPARKICLWIIATGRMVSGPFTNEYVWSMEFDEEGTRVIRWKEFADSISTRAIFPELMATDGHTFDTASSNQNVPTRADSMVSTASRASSNVSSQPSMPNSQSSQQSQQALQQPSQDGLPSPRPNSQLPPARSLRGVPTEIQGNGRTLGTLR